LILRPSWDIIQATCRTFQAHPALTLQHVKGNQDCSTHFWNRPLETQFNIQADKLATDFQEESSHGTDRGPIIPRFWVPFSQGKSSNPKQSPSLESKQTVQRNLMNYIQVRLQISVEALSNIDWESHSQAIRPVSIPNRIFLIKFIYPSHCPSCLLVIEEFDHIFLCPSPQRRRWQMNLRNDLFKLSQHSNTYQFLANIMIDGLIHWFRQTPHIPNPSLPHMTNSSSVKDSGANSASTSYW
jgi:hypothetical protein